MNKCKWILIAEDYYETDCSNSIEVVDQENICAIYCPYCGNKINFKTIEQ